MPESESGPVVLAREDLYEEVWSEPVSTVAKKYALSDVGLAKICRRLNVPVPGRGYWRQKQVGQKVRRPPLPKLPAGAADQMMEVRLRRTASGSAAPEPPGPVADQEEFERIEENRIVVSEMISDPHPLVAKTITALRGAKRNDRGHLIPKRACLAVHVTLDTADRAMCVYDALLKALDERGFETTVAGEGAGNTTVRVRDEDVPVLVEERIKRVEREIPESERTFSWRDKEVEWVPTGQLVLRIDRSHLDGIRRTWGDGKKQRVENCLNAFVVGLVNAAETLKAQRLAHEAWQREWREAEERRADERRRQEEEAGRIRALESAAARWQKATALREYLLAFRRAAEAEGLVEPGSEIERWLEWAEEHVDRVDPLRPVPAVPADPGRPTSHGYRSGYAR